MNQIIQTEKAPKAIGPYSQGVKTSGNTTLYLSGQIALNPQSGAMVNEDIEAETRQVMSNLQAVLEAGGATLQNVVRCTIFLTNLGDFARVNEVYGSYFKSQPPARATVQVSALPRGACVEIDAVAVL